MRPAIFLFVFLLGVSAIDCLLLIYANNGRQQQHIEASLLQDVTASLGLTDLCVTTEARYTRHPAVSDDLVPFMDHPGALEHFPSGVFFAPPFQTAER